MSSFGMSFLGMTSLAMSSRMTWYEFVLESGRAFSPRYRMRASGAHKMAGLRIIPAVRVIWAKLRF